MNSGNYKYKAYISYSHRDERWAKWLHKALESYRVPRKLVGTGTAIGEVPSRIKPVFRDRDDLSSASDLGGTVKQALNDSENMIVVCSPDAAASHWVNEEIRQFASLGRQKQIFCVIVDGEPGSAGVASTCFPVALAEIGLEEPLAADIRKWADGQRLSKLKLVAGMLGLSLDQLRRRDLQKRQRAWAMAAVASVAVAAVLVTAVTARIAAQQRRDSGESLVVYKLNELRTMLNVENDPSELSRLGDWSANELARLVREAGEGENALMVSALDLREQGISYWQNNALAQAMDKFQESWALLAEAYRRDDKNHYAFFELGQTEYWIGTVYMKFGLLDAAEDSLSAYAEITRQLIVLQPQNAEWVLEMSYALTNLGSLQRESGFSDPERALQLIQSALEYNQIALVLDPQNEQYQSELGQSHAFLADAQRGVCDLEGALNSRQKNVELERDLLTRDSESFARMKRLGWALSGLAVVQEAMGLNSDAIASLEEALELMTPVAVDDPDSAFTSRFMLDRKRRLAMLKAYSGSTDQAWFMLEELDEGWQQFLQRDGMPEYTTSEFGYFLLGKAWLAQLRGETNLANKLHGEAMTLFEGVLQILPQNRSAENMLMLSVFGNWEVTPEMPGQTILSLLPDYETNEGRTRSCIDADMAVRQAIIMNNDGYARQMTNYLLGNDYQSTDFIRVCNKFSLCPGQ